RTMLETGEKGGFARAAVQYRLLDWGISRQRYWGTPIPILYCDRCGIVPVPEADLPVVLPDDVPLTGEGGAPRARVASVLDARCLRCVANAKRETDIMEPSVDASW